MVANNVMRTSILLLAFSFALLTGCVKRARVGGGYELAQPRTYLIDTGSPACALR
jgi:hypothetical protein